MTVVSANRTKLYGDFLMFLSKYLMTVDETSRNKIQKNPNVHFDIPSNSVRREGTYIKIKIMMIVRIA